MNKPIPQLWINALVRQKTGKKTTYSGKKFHVQLINVVKVKAIYTETHYFFVMAQDLDIYT